MDSLAESRWDYSRNRQLFIFEVEEPDHTHRWSVLIASGDRSTGERHGSEWPQSFCRTTRWQSQPEPGSRVRSKPVADPTPRPVRRPWDALASCRRPSGVIEVSTTLEN